MLNSAFCIADRETDFCVLAMDGVGLTARRKTIGMPFEMPPRMPPQWFVSVTTRPSSTRYASLFSLPRRPAAAKPLQGVREGTVAAAVFVGMIIKLYNKKLGRVFDSTDRVDARHDLNAARL